MLSFINFAEFEEFGCFKYNNPNIITFNNTDHRPPPQLFDEISVAVRPSKASSVPADKHWTGLVIKSMHAQDVHHWVIIEAIITDDDVSPHHCQGNP